MAPPKGFIPWNKGLKGLHLSPKTEFRKGIRHSPSTEFKKGHKPARPIKKGERRGIKTEFEKGQKAWNRGIEHKAILWEKHFNFIDGYTKYRQHLIRSGRTPICEKCTNEFVWKALDVHHKDFNRRNNVLINLQVLCHKCHQNLHKNWEKRTRRFVY